jgi:hypothetical protein
MSSTHSIPEVGEWLATEVPAVRKLAHVTAGVSTQNPDVVVGDTAAYTLFSVTEPIVIFGLWTQTEEAFTTSVTLTIGISTAADVFIADTTINCASSGAALISATGLAVPYAMEEDILLDMNGATAAAGLLHVYLDYAVLED